MAGLVSIAFNSETCVEPINGGLSCIKLERSLEIYSIGIQCNWYKA